MNERIRELAEQSGLEYNFDPMLWLKYEKFAELIVWECAELCDRFQERDVGMQPAECAGAIRQMFGVRE